MKEKSKNYKKVFITFILVLVLLFILLLFRPPKTPETTSKNYISSAPNQTNTCNWITIEILEAKWIDEISSVCQDPNIKVKVKNMGTTTITRENIKDYSFILCEEGKCSWWKDFFELEVPKDISPNTTWEIIIHRNKTTTNAISTFAKDKTQPVTVDIKFIKETSFKNKVCSVNNWTLIIQINKNIWSPEDFNNCLNHNAFAP